MYAATDSGLYYADVNTSIGGELEVPGSFSLEQNYPNPFNPISNIKYKISKSSDVRITVFDVRGKEVEILVNERFSRGRMR